MVHMDILSILPDAWLPVLTYIVAGLIALLATIGAISAAVAGAKRYLGTPSPVDPPWKVRAWQLVKFCDPLAVNSQRAVDALTILQHELDLAAQRRALQAQQQALQEQEAVIRLQSAVIKDSMRPPAMPSTDADLDTGRETPTAKKGA